VPKHIGAAYEQCGALRRVLLSDAVQQLSCRAFSDHCLLMPVARSYACVGGGTVSPCTRRFGAVHSDLMRACCLVLKLLRAHVMPGMTEYVKGQISCCRLNSQVACVRRHMIRYVVQPRGDCVLKSQSFWRSLCQRSQPCPAVGALLPQTTGPPGHKTPGWRQQARPLKVQGARRCFSLCLRQRAKRTSHEEARAKKRLREFPLSRPRSAGISRDTSR
jgi:hypothetical protein